MIDVNWLFVIIKNYVKVNFKEIITTIIIIIIIIIIFVCLIRTLVQIIPLLMGFFDKYKLFGNQGF